MDVYTSTRPSPPRQITPSESDSASSSPEAHRRTHTQTWFPSPPIELSSSSSAAMQGAPTSGSLNGSHQGGRSGTLSKDRDFKGRASARRALYTSSGFTRVASSRATTSSGSSMSRYPDFNVPPIDLQLPPARAARSSRTPVRSSAPLGVDPASPTSVSSTGVAIQVGPFNLFAVLHVGRRVSPSLVNSLSRRQSPPPRPSKAHIPRCSCTESTGQSSFEEGHDAVRRYRYSAPADAVLPRARAWLLQSSRGYILEATRLDR